MSQNFDHKPKKVLVTGGSGTGKTTLTEELMGKEKAKLVFIYDHDGQFFSRFDKGTLVQTADGLDAAVCKGGYIIYDPAFDFPEDFSKGLDFFSEYVLTVSKVVKGRKIFYVDEVDLLTSNMKYPASLVAVLQTGRRHEIDCFLIASQPNTLHNRIRTQLTEVYSFLHTDESAMKFLTDNGFKADDLRLLGNHGWAYRHLRTGAVKWSGKRKTGDGEPP